jgi:hypothetical protein
MKERVEIPVIKWFLTHIQGQSAQNEFRTALHFSSQSHVTGLIMFSSTVTQILRAELKLLRPLSQQIDQSRASRATCPSSNAVCYRMSHNRRSLPRIQHVESSHHCFPPRPLTRSERAVSRQSRILRSTRRSRVAVTRRGTTHSSRQAATAPGQDPTGSRRGGAWARLRWHWNRSFCSSVTPTQGPRTESECEAQLGHPHDVDRGSDLRSPHDLNRGSSLPLRRRELEACEVASSDHHRPPISKMLVQ